MLMEALEYPRRSEKVLETVLIGGVLTLLSFLLVPLVFLAGYLIRVLDRTAHGDEEPPVFDDWRELGVDGLKALAVGIVYGLVPAVVVGVLVLISGLGFMGGDAMATLGFLGLLVSFLAGIVLTLAVAYLAPAALANVAEHRTIGAGFDLAELKPVWTSATYATGWLWALAVIFVGIVVAGVIGMVPVLGQIAGAFVGFYAGVAAYSIIGRTWGELHPIETRERPVERGQPEI
jgi:hypothetical protein